MRTIHWLGAGLSSIYGLNYFSQSKNYSLKIWVRDPAKVERNWPNNENTEILKIGDVELRKSIQKNDIVVSMLPYSLHSHYARIALENKSHFICSSYVSDELENLAKLFEKENLSLICEMGLDPGIDHMLTHKIINIIKSSGICLEHSKMSILSLCGGIPEVPNDFKYKFSWSPVGILKALRNQSFWIENGEYKFANHPWEAVRLVEINNEEFEYYPNRDSSKFISFFNLNKSNLNLFLRGSIRLKGWKNSWSNVFKNILHMNDSELESYAFSLQQKYPYQKDDYDRVVMLIKIEVTDPNSNRHIFSATIDDVGCEEHSSMSKLVCIPIIGCIENLGIFSHGLVRPSSSNLELNYFENILKQHGVEVSYSISKYY